MDLGMLVAVGGIGAEVACGVYALRSLDHHRWRTYIALTAVVAFGVGGPVGMSVVDSITDKPRYVQEPAELLPPSEDFFKRAEVEPAVYESYSERA